MSALKRFGEWYLGVENAGPGQGTSWRFFARASWLDNLPPWFTLLLCVTLIGGVVYVYRRDARSLRPARRWTLVTLRLLVLALLVVFLLQITLAIDRTSLPYVVIMLDDSTSMQFQDDYARADAEVVRRLLGQETQPTRANVARGVLTAADGRFLRSLDERYRLRLYRFADNAQAIGTKAERADGADGLIRAIGSLKSDGPATRPAPAARQVLEEFRGTPPTAVVMLTDGIASHGNEERLPAVARLARRRGVPFYIVGIGSPRPVRDLQLHDMMVDEVAIVDETVLVTAELRTQGYEQEEVVVELRNQANQELLASTTVAINASSQPIELTWVPSVPGEFDITLGVVPPDDEQVLDNNSETRHVSVREGRIRVLLADHFPRWEYRFLKHLFERSDPRTRSIELHTVLFDADPGWHELDATASSLRGRLPSTREELFKYDVVIFGDIPAEFLSPAVQSALRDFVREKGGGLVLVPGPRHNPHAYRGTPLEPLIPVPLDRVTASSFTRLLDEGFHVAPTLPGRRTTPLFRFGETESESVRVAGALHQLHTRLEIPELPPGVTVLADVPDAGRAALILARQFGAGRVVMHATDDLWAWRFRAGDAWFGRYWTALVRYLSRSRLLGRDRGAELLTNRQVYERSEDVTFRLRFLDGRLIPDSGDVTINVERRGGPALSIDLTPAGDSPEVFEGVLPAPGEGTYHAWVSRPNFEDTPPSTDFRVETSARELLRRELDKSGLVETARQTRGRYYSVGTADRLLRDLPAGRAVATESGEPIVLWSRPELLLLCVGLLTLEWFLRKNARLI